MIVNRKISLIETNLIRFNDKKFFVPFLGVPTPYFQFILGKGGGHAQKGFLCIFDLNILLEFIKKKTIVYKITKIII